MDNRKSYEKFLGATISDRTWQRDKALMKKADLKITQCNLKIFASVKNQAKRFSLPIEQTVFYFLSFQPIQNLKGIDIYFKILNFVPKKPHRTTIHRWFPGGYQLEKVYQPHEVSEILLHAYIYKLKLGDKENATRPQAHRSYQISA
jgi:hypothetical protein